MDDFVRLYCRLHYVVCRFAVLTFRIVRRTDLDGIRKQLTKTTTIYSWLGRMSYCSNEIDSI